MRRWIVIAAVASLLATPAHALCIYDGKMYAKTSLAQEFRDAKWVVKAKVEAGDYHWANYGPSWTIYTVRVLTRFKGPQVATFRLFTYRDSGGFYLDKGGDPDLDVDYLLFLDPATQTLPHSVTNVVQVNYACGQSKRWSDLTPADRGAIVRLARR